MSFDTLEENRAFAEKFSFPYPLLCDVDRALGVAYGACNSPDAGSARRIVVVIGEEGDILSILDSVDVSSLPDTLLKELAPGTTE